MDDRTIDRIYAGLLGMDAGMRLGAPVENPWWTYERLREYFGNMTGYLREQNVHPPDDDVNGPVIFVRALTDNSGMDFTEEQAGETWLNYTRCGRGMFWWGGEDVSTEHRAFMNLKRGLHAPGSGSIRQNGIVAAEQIGGQIFVDCWGLICPGDPDKAAYFARKMASVSHDGEALEGAAFMAAAVAAAFTAGSVDRVLDEAEARIAPDSMYRKTIKRIRDFHADHPEDFRACRDMVAAEIPNPGDYHIIPNAAICITALLYGGGDLGRTIETAVMCGFDTDCNASNVGTILGVLGGPEGIPARYRAPINDSLTISSVSGYLNLVDIPSFAKELAGAACRLRGEAVPEWAAAEPGTVIYDFAFPGSTHGLRLSDRASYELRWRDAGPARTGRGCLELQIDGKSPEEADLTLPVYLLEEDFESSRYDPVFAPAAYPGQHVTISMKSIPTAPGKIVITPFVNCALSGERICLDPVTLPDGEWTDVSYLIPDLAGDQARGLGWQVKLELNDPPWAWDKVLIDQIRIEGPMAYTIDPAIQKMAFGEPAPFSTNDGEGIWKDGCLEFSGTGPAQAFTGNYYMRHTCLEAEVEAAEGACLLLRGQGTRRYYALGFDVPGRVAIIRRENGVRTGLASAAQDWEPGRTYVLFAEASGGRLTLSVGGEQILQAFDEAFSYGMAGICHESAAAAYGTEKNSHGVPKTSRWKKICIKAGL